MRSIHAPLSPNEELTLRRITLGISKPKKLRVQDVVRLKNLGLLEEREGRIALTEAGDQRQRTLPTFRANALV